MLIKTGQLEASLAKNLAPVYLFSGDEPLQLGEAADAVRKAAQHAGFENRELLMADSAHFNWNQLAETADSFSIFADKKIIDLRLPTGTVGVEGAKALVSYCERLPDATLLLITLGKLSKDALKSRWIQAIDKQGIVMQVWPLEGHDLQHWLQRRMQQRGLDTSTEGLRILLNRVEGNLLAAAQEIEKLYVLYGRGRIESQQIADAVADSSRYDVFKLMDSVLSANVGRIFKILSGLKAEGVAAPIVLWALTREARMLIKIKLAVAAGQNRDVVFRNNQIWDKRKQLVTESLTRLSDSDLQQLLILSAKADRQSKGQERGDVWETLLSICLQFASVPLA